MDIQAIALKGQTTEKVEEDMKTIKGVEKQLLQRASKDETAQRRDRTRGQLS